MNRFGRRLSVQIFGESHGPGIGVLLDGVPPGLPIDMDAIQADLDARRPGTGPFVSARQESDVPECVSGTMDGHATGAPLMLLIRNEDTRSKDYSELRRKPRPGHSDYPARIWSGGHYDHRGGGHHSGRLTAGLVAAGSLVRPLLDKAGIRVGAHLDEVAGIRGAAGVGDMPVAAMLQGAHASAIHTAHADAEAAMIDAIQAARADKDSVGGSVAWRAEGCPVGLGDPFFDSAESLLAHLFFSVPAVKGVDFGDGFASTQLRGSQHNDAYRMDGENVVPTTNHAGGILGGRTSGAPLWGRVAIKPTSSIFQVQDTVDLDAGTDAELELKGRHDPCIAIRAVPVVRACTELVLADLLLQAMQEGLVEAVRW